MQVAVLVTFALNWVLLLGALAEAVASLLIESSKRPTWQFSFARVCLAMHALSIAYYIIAALISPAIHSDRQLITAMLILFCPSIIGITYWIIRFRRWAAERTSSMLRLDEEEDRASA
jgi:hypothetical protein